MKILVKILGGLVALIVLAIAGLVAWPFVPVVQDQFGGAEHRAWLAEHSTEIDLEDTAPDFGLGPDIEDSRFVLLSELHGYRAVQALDLALVEHFAATGPARTYLAELGPDQAMAFNHYLATGDDAPARAVFDAWAEEDAQWANLEFFQKLGALRDLNASLPAARQIWFVGVDRPADRDLMTGSIERFDSQATPDFTGYEGVQAINVALGRAALSRDEGTSRYGHILPNIDQLNALDPERHYYGLWGLFHGAKTTVNGVTPLAMRLNQAGGAFEGSLTTLTTMCIDGCLNLMPARVIPGFLHGDDEPDYVFVPINFDDVMLQRARGVNEIKAAMGEASIASLRMTGEGSPYEQGPRLSALTGYLSYVQSFRYGGPAAELTDYFVVLRGSAGLTPWSGTVHDVTGTAAETGINGMGRRLEQAGR